MPSRRRFLHLAAVSPAMTAMVGPTMAQIIEDDRLLKPGQFTWHPDRSPDGPVSIIVSIPEQLVHVYRNGIRIGVSTCSTGRPGHPTPTGVFTILQKQTDHRSNIYDSAPMPDMERLTWTGIALHVGGLPGYPSSHGCVHLPRAFSDKLYAVTHVGTAVIIADTSSAPEEVIHPGLVLSDVAEKEIDGALATISTRSLPGTSAGSSPSAPLSILVSSADKRFMMLLDGDTIAEGAITMVDPGQPIGSHVFIFSRVLDGGLAWQAIAHSSGSASSPQTGAAAVLARIRVDPAGQKTIADHLHPGALLITTDLPLAPDRQSGKDFVVVSSQDS